MTYLTDDAFLIYTVLAQVMQQGVSEFCICPGGRNAPFIAFLKKIPAMRCYYFHDERSAAFFALGRAQLLQCPVAVITTSGTAIAHLLAAVMEAYYTATPLVLMTADRPRRFRLTNAPQACEQVGIYGIYTPLQWDLAQEDLTIECEDSRQTEFFSLHEWRRDCPIHLNICLEEESSLQTSQVDHLLNAPDFKQLTRCPEVMTKELTENYLHQQNLLEEFLKKVQKPLVIVGKLERSARQPIIQFLQHLQAPLYLEALSGLREEPVLQPLSIHRTQEVLKKAQAANYKIDGILRLGGLPISRLWRDLEYNQHEIAVLSLNSTSFKGLSFGSFIHCHLSHFFENYSGGHQFDQRLSEDWRNQEKQYQKNLWQLLTEEPLAEASLIHTFSKRLSRSSLLFLGNSLPIREWDLAASNEARDYRIHASRGLNGIDGQVSTFLGLCDSKQDNWALLGDLTTLHDLSGFWILPQLPAISASIAVINNGGGKIFERLFVDREIQNCHTLRLEPLAKLWNMAYETWTTIPLTLTSREPRLIEILPDAEASSRFWHQLKLI